MQPKISTIYLVPDPLESHEQAIKFDHLDLSDLDDFALWQEDRRVELVLTLPTSVSDRRWLLERRVAVRREQRARRSVA